MNTVEMGINPYIFSGKVDRILLAEVEYDIEAGGRMSWHTDSATEVARRGFLRGERKSYSINIFVP